MSFTIKFFVNFLLLAFVSSCTSVFYYPRVAKTKFYDPSQVHLKEENVEIETPLGWKIHAWWFKAQNSSEGEKSAKGTIIFFHGNAQNLTAHFLNLAWIPYEDYNYLIWDYPGYGVSEGEPSPEANVVSAKSVVQWVHEHKDPRPLIIYGQSLGGAVALRTVLDIKDQIPIKACILDSTFSSYRSLARRKAEQSWLTWVFQPLAWLLMSDQFSGNEIERLTPIPLLFIVGLQDKVIPPDVGEDLFEKAKEPKQIWRLANGQHTDVFWIDEKIHRKEFLDYLSSLK